MANIYNLVRGITDAKKSWETHNASGNDIQRDKAQDSAQPFYDDLEEAGRKDLADKLKNANYEEAEKIYDELYGNKSENETLNAPTEMKTQGEAEASAAGSTPSAEDTLNAVSGKNTPSDMIEDANAKADEYYNSVVAPKLEEDVFDSDYADAIFRVYGIKAKDAHDAALGDYTASNEGNLDSWSGAHAGRIYLDTLGRAIDKVTDYSEAEQNRLLDWYDRLTGNQLDLIDRSQTSTNADRTFENADKDRESNEKIEQAKLDSAKAINTENSTTDKYIADKNENVALKGYESNERMNDADNASAEKINAADNASQERINAADNASEEKIAETKKASPINFDDIHSMLTQSKEDKISKEQALSMIANYFGYDTDAYKYASANIDSIYEGDNIFA